MDANKKKAVKGLIKETLKALENNNMEAAFVETKEELPERQILVAYNDRIPMPKSVKTFLEYF